MRYFNHLMLGLGVVVAVGGLTACSELHEREARRTGRTAGQVVTDESTDRRVRDALHNSPVYKFREVGVVTYNGIVQLNGFVDTQNQKHAAEEISRTVPGVQHIVNNIAVKSEVAPTGRGNGEYRAPIYDSQQPPAPQPNPNVGVPNANPNYNPPAYTPPAEVHTNQVPPEQR